MAEPKDAAQVEEAKVETRSEWDDDFDKEELTIKYKPDPVEEKEDEVKEETPETKEEEVEEVVVEPIVKTEDPGEFQEPDLSFVQKIDGKDYKISKADDIDNIPAEDLEKLNAKELTSLIRKGNAIDSKLERAKEDYDKKKSEYDEQVNAEKERDEQIQTMANEFEYLVSKGLLPKVADEFKNANWADPKVSEQPGVKEQKELLDYMIKENQARAKVNVKPLTSIVDAYNAWQLENTLKDKEQATKNAGQARKDAGAKVAGISNNPPGMQAPKGIAIGRPNAFMNNAAQWEN